ncbi:MULTISPECIES: DUF6850 family outer membrane beta-barrel protein [Chitinophagaceae]
MKKLSYLISLFLSLSVSAQYAPDSLWQEASFKNKTLAFDNAVMGVYVDSGSVGNSSISYFQNHNQFRDAFTPRTSNGFAVRSEQFMALKGWKFYGTFTFSKYEDKDTRYTELANPYSDNPYKIMDSVATDWRKQYYLLQANIVSPYINRRTRLGMGIKYEVLNGARQRDPRPLDKNLNITLTPSVMYDLSRRIKIGFNGFYNHFVEDLSISMENTQHTQNIYKTLGLGEYLYNGPILLSVSASRAYLGNTWGGGVSWTYDVADGKYLYWSTDYKKGREKVTDGTTTPYNAGTHESKELSIQLAYRATGPHMEHILSIRGLYRTSSDTEYVQILSSTTKLYEVIYASEMHHKKTSALSLQYNGLYRKVQILWRFSGGADFVRSVEDYPTTLSNETVSNLEIHAGASRWFNLGDGRLSATYNVRYKMNLEKSLTYYSNTSSSNFVANNILYPNYYFNTADWISNTIGIQYDFKKLAKNNSRVYVKASFENLRPINSVSFFSNGISNNSFVLTLGIFN